MGNVWRSCWRICMCILGLNCYLRLYKRMDMVWNLPNTPSNIKKLCIFNSFYSLDSCNQSLKWSLLGVQKRLGHAQIGLFRGFIQNFRPASPPLSYGSLPPGAEMMNIRISCTVSAKWTNNAKNEILAVKMSKRKRYLSVLDKSCWDKSRKCLFFPFILAKLKLSPNEFLDSPPPLIQSCLG